MTPNPVDWPWHLDVTAGMTDEQHAAWRAESSALREHHVTRLGRALMGRELIVFCDRPAAETVLGPAPSPLPRAMKMTDKGLCERCRKPGELSLEFAAGSIPGDQDGSPITLCKTCMAWLLSEVHRSDDHLVRTAAAAESRPAPDAV